jgi:hypothetical protein
MRNGIDFLKEGSELNSQRADWRSSAFQFLETLIGADRSYHAGRDEKSSHKA